MDTLLGLLLEEIRVACQHVEFIPRHGLPTKLFETIERDAPHLAMCCGTVHDGI